ncbi:hypothetical protein [Streptomyces sp. NPDC059893]
MTGEFVEVAVLLHRAAPFAAAGRRSGHVVAGFAVVMGVERS